MQIKIIYGQNLRCYLKNKVVLRIYEIKWHKNSQITRISV